MNDQVTFQASSSVIRGFSESKLAKGEKGDCVVKAMATACSVKYDTAHKFVTEKMNRGFRKGTKTLDILSAFKDGMFELGEKKFEVEVLSGRSIHNYYKLHGELVQRKKTVKSFIKYNDKGTYLVLVSKHAFVVKDGVLIDNKGEEFRPTRKVTHAFQIKDVTVEQLSIF